MELFKRGCSFCCDIKGIKKNHTEGNNKKLEGCCFFYISEIILLKNHIQIMFKWVSMNFNKLVDIILFTFWFWFFVCGEFNVTNKVYITGDMDDFKMFVIF